MGIHKYTLNTFLIKAKKIHGDKYDYSKAIYNGNKCSLLIICPIHGEFKQTPHSHLKGYGCTKCGRIIMSDKIKLDVKSFIDRSIKIHNNKFDYSLVLFNSVNDKIEIICPTHGSFKQVVSGHLSGRGCAKCNQSKGEKLIARFLADGKINNHPQHKFINCINPSTNKPLPFDFYLPDINTCVEYDGQQHFISNDYFKHEKFEMRQKRDQIKNEYCSKNNIRLIRIKYNENVEARLKCLI